MAMAATTSSTMPCEDFPKTRAHLDAPPLCRYVGKNARNKKKHCPIHYITCPVACGMCPRLDNAWDNVVSAMMDFVADDGTTTLVTQIMPCTSYVKRNPATYCSLPGAAENCQATCLFALLVCRILT